MLRHTVLFEGIDASGLVGLWTTNGSAAGTYELTGIGDASTVGNGLSPGYFTLFNGEVLFVGTDSSLKQGLWATRGTAASTSELSGISNVFVGSPCLMVRTQAVPMAYG